MEKSILIIHSGALDDSSGNNTIQNIFQSFDSKYLHVVYLRSDLPNCKKINSFFQISELNYFKKILGLEKKCGNEILSTFTDKQKKSAKEEDKVKSIYKKFPSSLILAIREFFWGLGFWKEKELNNYIDKCKPDYIFVYVTSFIFSNRIAKYIAEYTKKPVILYFVDDNLSYKAITKNPLAFYERYKIRKAVKDLLPYTKKVCVISPMMKKEYDKFLGVNSIILTKSAEFDNSIHYTNKKDSYKILYAGNLLYGRDKSILELAKYLKEEKLRAYIDVYTPTKLSKKVLKEFELSDRCNIKGPVPYSELCELRKSYDFLLFAESFKKKQQNIVRLSFSTKITEYMCTGIPIIAIGPDSIAPIQYLIENKCAYVISQLSNLKGLQELFNNKDLRNTISKNALNCIKEFHSQNHINSIMNKLFE